MNIVGKPATHSSCIAKGTHEPVMAAWLAMTHCATGVLVVGLRIPRWQHVLMDAVRGSIEPAMFKELSKP